MTADDLAPFHLDPLELLAQVPVALAALVREGSELRIGFVSDELRRMLGYRGPLGVPAGELLGPATVQRAAQVLSAGSIGHLGPATLADRTVRGTLQPLRDRAGVVRGVTVAYHDVTDDELIRQTIHAACIEAEQASQRKNRLVASIAHDVRAPVMTLLLWETLLRSGSLAGEELERAFDAIRDSAQMLSQIAADLQDLARAIDGELELELRPLELAPVILDALARCEPEAQARQLVIERSIAPALGTIQGDPDRLRQIFDVLLRAISTAAATGDRLAVTARRDSDRVAIELRDGGQGLTRERLAFVFEDGGLGTGLAIARELVRLHDGTIEVASAGPGTGATFTIVLPAR